MLTLWYSNCKLISWMVDCNVVIIDGDGWSDTNLPPLSKKTQRARNEMTSSPLATFLQGEEGCKKGGGWVGRVGEEGRGDVSQNF